MKKTNSHYHLDYLPQPMEPMRLSEHVASLAEKLGNKPYAYMGQIHSDVVKVVTEPGYYDDCDAIISTVPDLILFAQFADCVPIYVYDIKKPHYAIIHSGWRGTKENIVTKVLRQLIQLGSVAEDLFVVIGPCISQKNYEVGKEFKELFSESYIIEDKGRLYLDLKQCVFDQAHSIIEKEHIFLDKRCTYSDPRLHSYRRDGKQAKRNIGFILYET